MHSLMRSSHPQRWTLARMSDYTMFEDRPVHTVQRSKPKRSKSPKVASAPKQSKDDFIMDTNNSSIVSKRSVEKLYYTGEPEYFRYFVRKFKRRAPLINRGYWLRMRAVEHTAERFLEQHSEKRKIVINLGCGYDPLPWLFLGKRMDLCTRVTFVDVDYPQLMHKKVDVITETEPLSSLLPQFRKSSSRNGLLAQSDNYAAIGCDLRDLALLRQILQEHLQIETCAVEILLVAEVSVAYMDLESSQAVFEWAASYEDVRFCLLEQHLPDGPDHPFAQTMLKHFEKLRTPLRAIGTMQDMQHRFRNAGWPVDGINIRALWDLWSDTEFLSADQRRALDNVEPFDEWEEFALFASHYFLLIAQKGGEAESKSETREMKYQPGLEHRRSSAALPLVCEELSEAHSHRRFAAILPSPDRGLFGIHGGLGTQERLANVAVYTDNKGNSTKAEVKGPPLRNGLMCHTITKLGNTNEHLLVGGRTSPDRANADTWVRREKRWEKVQSLPDGIYRHCAVSVINKDSLPGVLVLGGKMSSGRLLENSLLWTENEGWRHLECPGRYPPARFGSMTIPDDATGMAGLLFGGMADDGTIHQDAWRWYWDGRHTINYEDFTSQMGESFGENTDSLWRFGAQSVCWNVNEMTVIFVVGGVKGDSMLTRQNEVVNMDKHCTHSLRGPRPLLVGTSLQGRLCLGGGATCFSFGTHWNDAVSFRFENEDARRSPWRFRSVSLANVEANHGSHQKPASDNISDGPMAKLSSIPRVRLSGKDQFGKILASQEPVVFEGCNLGECTSKWTPTYLKSAIGEQRKVVVHTSPDAKMDFQSKNFRYETMEFGRFIESMKQGDRLYLRSLSRDAPSEEPTSLAHDYPEIADDFVLPPELEYVVANAHSTPLRISGQVAMWLHYDVMANTLCQIGGTKRLVLFPPSDVSRLGFDAGASSSSIDVLDVGGSSLAKLEGCHPCEAILKPGDVLFIPALWLHSAAPTEDMSIAVNVFFRHLQHGYAAGRDVYGNRDVAAYEKGRKDVAKIVRSFADLPDDMSRFYLERLGMELLSSARS